MFVVFATALLSLAASALATPATPTTVPGFAPSLVRRTQPTFPTTIPSCVQCQAAYPSINTCAQAAPVLANFTQVIFNPGAFVDVIKCACTDTFKTAYPECVDCFQQTNQTDVLDAGTTDLPSIVTGLRNVCAVASVILSNVSASESAAASGSAANTGAPQSQSTGSTSGAPARWTGLPAFLALALVVPALLL